MTSKFSNSQLSMVNGQWSSRGFTLLELIVVIAIISVLTTLLSVNFISIRQRGRDAQRKSEIRQIQSALELYNGDNGSYPETLPSCGSQFITGSVSYMKEVPCDPQGEAISYQYVPDPAGCEGTSCTGYSLYACIENTSDQDQNISDTNPGGNNCESLKYFVVTNPF